MSLPQQNKFAKHKQHALLQKEEDEEQWISGEELCTEGSSDEETTSKDLKRKDILRPSNSSTFRPKSILSVTNKMKNLKEKSTDKSETESLHSETSSSMEWRPKRVLDEYDKIYNIAAEKLNIEMEFKNTLEQLENDKNKLKNNNLENPESNEPVFIIDSIIELDKQIENCDRMLECCKRDRKTSERSICAQIKKLNTCALTCKSSENFRRICRYKGSSTRARLIAKSKLKWKRHKLNLKLYSRSNKFKMNERKMDVNYFTKEQESRLEDILGDLEETATKPESETIFEIENNHFKCSNEQVVNLKIINSKLKILQEKYADADLKSKKSEETNYSADEENREWKEYFKMNDDKLRKINTRLKTLQQVRSTENTKVGNTEKNQQ